MDQTFKEVKIVEDKTWLIRRRGTIEEVVDWDGSVKYRVTIQDVGRAPFIRRLFISPSSAQQFYDRIMIETAVKVEA